MKVIKTKMLFPFIRLLNKLDMKGTILSLFVDATGKSEEEKEALTKQVFARFFIILTEKLEEAENEFYAFMSAYLEKPREEVEEEDIFVLIDEFKKLVEHERFKSFLDLALQKAK